MGLRSDAGLLAEEYNPKTYGLMGSFPQPFSHVALETMAVDISRRRGLPSGDRDRALHTSLFRLSSSDGSGLYLERDKTMSEIPPRCFFGSLRKLGLSTRDASRQRLTATTSNFPRFASANLIRYNSCDRGIKHACDKDGEGQWQRQRLKRRIALL